MDKKSIFATGALIFILGMFLGMYLMLGLRSYECEQKTILQDEVNLLKEILQEQNQ